MFSTLVNQNSVFFHVVSCIRIFSLRFLMNSVGTEQCNELRFTSDVFPSFILRYLDDYFTNGSTFGPRTECIMFTFSCIFHAMLVTPMLFYLEMVCCTHGIYVLQLIVVVHHSVNSIFPILSHDQRQTAIRQMIRNQRVCLPALKRNRRRLVVFCFFINA